MTIANRQRAVSALADYLMTNIAVLLFNIVRYRYFSQFPVGDIEAFLTYGPVAIGQIVMPIIIMLVYYLSGYYYDPIFRSRVDEFLKTVGSTLVGALLFYFAVVINDRIDDRGEIYELVGYMWGVLMGCVYPVRIILTNVMLRRAHTNRAGYNTLVLGTSQTALRLVESLESQGKKRRFNVIGLVNCRGEGNSPSTNMTVFELSDLEDVISEYSIEQLIVVPHHNGMRATLDLVNSLFPTGLQIYVSPTLYHLISGRMPVEDIVGEPLVNISRPAISSMTASIKRFSDLVLSSIALVALIPAFCVIALSIRIDTKGPVLFLQDRVGRYKRPFKIIKFRTMCLDAEAEGPSLSSPDDPRVTRVGHFLRKYRLDELPQFWNVIRGEMSIVGPRPERRYYIDQIVKRAPYYSLIHQVRPGITSLGMVKFGYAENVDEMIERLKYDIIYIENISLATDVRIMFYTFNTVFTGRGV